MRGPTFEAIAAVEARITGKPCSAAAARLAYEKGIVKLRRRHPRELQQMLAMAAELAKRYQPEPDFWDEDEAA